MLTPELDENTEKLTQLARQLINAEFRNLVWDDVSKKIQATQFQALSPEPQSASKVSKTIAVKTARKKIRDEWEALKNDTIISNDSPESHLSDVLRGVVAYIEINNVPKSVALTAILQNLGATVKETFTPVVTHVIFKRGTLDTFKRAKLLKVHLVSVLWIEACKNARKKISEDMFPVPEHSDYTSPRTFRRFMEGLDSEERDKLVKRATRRTTNLPRLQDQRVTRSSAQSDSSESAIVLRVSTDDSGNKTSKQQKGKTKKLDLKSQKPTAGIQKTKDKIPNKRRLFGSGRYKTIDNGGSNKLDAKTKRKLFTHNRLDDTSLGVSTLLDSSESSSGSTITGINPYQIPGKPKIVRKKKVQSQDQNARRNVNGKENNYESTDSECESPNSSIERRERVEEIVKVTQIQSETEKKRTKEKKRRLIKEKKKKMTKEDREIFMKANKIARRQENQILKASQPRSCKKLDFNYSKEIQNPSLVSTFLHQSENRYLKECVDRLGGFTFKAVVGANTTHVVSGGPVRTINLLKGLSRGCWLLDKRWAEESMRAGHWLAEHDYELVKFSPAVQKCRIERQALGSDYRLDIFRRVGGVYVSARCVTRRDLRALVSLCGGAPVSEPNGARVVVGERIDSCTCVSEQWILDSIAAGRCKSLSKYMVA